MQPRSRWKPGKPTLFWVLLWVPFMIPTKEGMAETPLKTQPDSIIFSGNYPGWPWVCEGKGGTLYCVFREGTVHMYSADGRVMLSRSTDGGKTWSPARVIIDTPNVDDRNVAITELPGGDLLINYNTYTKEAVSQAMISRSTDEGETWSSPRPIETIPDSRTRASAKALSNGWILIPLYLDPGKTAVAALSKDDGKTWKGIRIPNCEKFVGDEWDLIEMEPGHLIGMSRNNFHPSDRFIYKFESHDFGMTWETPEKTNIQTGRLPAPVQIFFQNKVPTMIYPDQREVSVAAVFTRDPALLEWNLERKLPCYAYNEDRSPLPDGGYAVSAPVGRKKRVIVDYEIRKERKQISGYFIEFPQDWGEE